MKKKKVISIFFTSLNGMAYGLFATLIIGTIFGTIVTILSKIDNNICSLIAKFLNNKDGVGYVLQIMTGAGIGIALALKLNSLETIVLAACGEIASFFSLSTLFVNKGIYANNLKIGAPLTIYLVCICVFLLMKLVLRKKTPVDVLIIPLFGVICRTIISLLIRYPAIYITCSVQLIVNSGTNAAPFLMGIIISVVMGMALTAPISSTAIAAMFLTFPEGIDIQTAINMSEYHSLIIASGAAIISYSTQMV